MGSSDENVISDGIVELTDTTLDDAVQMVSEVVQTGAAGSTIGRNVWGFRDIPLAVERLKQAMHPETCPGGGGAQTADTQGN